MFLKQFPEMKIFYGVNYLDYDNLKKENETSKLVQQKFRFYL